MSIKRLRFSEFCLNVEDTQFNFIVYVHGNEKITYPTSIRKINRKYYRTYNKKYRLENKEKLILQKRQYYLNNIEQYKNRNKKFFKQNPNYRKKWRKENPQKAKLRDLKRNSRIKRWGIPQPINEYFEGSHFHHLHIDGNHEVGIYIPVELHRSIPHRYNNQDSMDKINKEAIKWYE